MRYFLTAIMAFAVVGANPGAASAQAFNDHQIVPGQRIGPVTLGMTAADLYRVMGEPKSSFTYNNGGSTYGWSDGLSVSIQPNGRVDSITVGTAASGLYKLSGLTVGSSNF